ncbi:hypothetical protein RN001_005534 [Aquatica leii]|uniref:Uncharacterized protein n=1 Tax=Aquatica leii TaxID=1421715 RepID=A0AAN7Q7A7_9COLE|nr:hypothetical protein RN001_005534 [Aquatica leii]
MSNKRYCSKYRFIKNKLKEKLPTNININKNGEVITCDNESGSGKLGTENTLRSINVSFSESNANINNTSTTTTDWKDRSTKIVNFLKLWALEKKINLSQLNSLLNGITNIIPELNLPKDARTVLQTKRALQIITMKSSRGSMGYFYYFGMSYILELYFNDDLSRKNIISYYFFTARMWDIIIWCDEDAIDFVPSVWASSDYKQYKYPIGLNQNKIREIIYECKDIVENYRWCQAKVKKTNIKSLQRAKDLCSKGLYTSNLDTSDDEGCNTSVRKKTRRLIEEYDAGDNSRQRQRKIHWSEENLNQEKLEAVENRKRFTFPVDTTEEVCNVHKDPPSNANSVPSVTFYSNREGGTVHTDDVHSISSRSTPTGSSGVFPNHDQHTELLQTILKTQIEIKFEINELRKKVDKIENKEINQNKVDFGLQTTTTFVDKLRI